MVNGLENTQRAPQKIIYIIAPYQIRISFVHSFIGILNVNIVIIMNVNQNPTIFPYGSNF